jgi:hypothetical protein
VPDPRYPTPQQERGAQAVLTWFAQQPATQVVLLTNSCARGKATADSCLDLLVLAPTESVAGLGAAWTRVAAASSELAELAAAGRWAELHLDVADGVFVARPIEHELDCSKSRSAMRSPTRCRCSAAASASHS